MTTSCIQYYLELSGNVKGFLEKDGRVILPGWGLDGIGSLMKVYSDYQSCLLNVKLWVYCFSSHLWFFIDLNEMIRIIHLPCGLVIPSHPVRSADLLMKVLD